MSRQVYFPRGQHRHPGAPPYGPGPFDPGARLHSVELGSSAFQQQAIPGFVLDRKIIEIEGPHRFCRYLPADYDIFSLINGREIGSISGTGLLQGQTDLSESVETQHNREKECARKWSETSQVRRSTDSSHSFRAGSRKSRIDRSTPDRSAECVSTPTTFAPAARAAAAPAGESSKTIQSAGATPSRYAARRYISGNGFGRSTWWPSTMTRNHCRSPAPSRTKSIFAGSAFDASPIGDPFEEARNSTTPGTRWANRAGLIMSR